MLDTAFNVWSRTRCITDLASLHKSPFGADGLTQSRNATRRLNFWMMLERVILESLWGLKWRVGFRSSKQSIPPAGTA